jgi:SagB-type dehydrogenase family enzyme
MHLNIISLKKDFLKVESPGIGDYDMENSIALLYHENSKLDYYSARMLGYNIKKLDNSYVHERASRPYKTYPGTPITNLDFCSVKKNKLSNLKRLISDRRSARSFEQYNITCQDIFSLLHFSYGIHKKVPVNENGAFWGRRAIPSAGALYPLELYILILQGDEIKKGLYHYRPDLNSVELLKEGDFKEDISGFIQADPSIDVDVKSASILLISTSVFERVLTKYLERGYRFLMMEVGALGQSITLLSESIGLNSCYVGSFWDDSINEFLGLDGISESVQSVLAIGKTIKVKL